MLRRVGSMDREVGMVIQGVEAEGKVCQRVERVERVERVTCMGGVASKPVRVRASGRLCVFIWKGS
jgi:hypothetical protein